MLAQGTNRHRPAARYEKPAKRLSISLGGQEADCTMPSYGRAGLIDGVVTLAPETLEKCSKTGSQGTYSVLGVAQISAFTLSCLAAVIRSKER